jgi:hypothetical protein
MKLSFPPSLRFGLLATAALIGLSCGGDAQSLPDGAAGAGGTPADAQAGTGGGAAGSGGAAAGSGGGGAGGADAGSDGSAAGGTGGSPVDAAACTDIEMPAGTVMPTCTVVPRAMGDGTPIPDGHYEVVSVALEGGVCKVPGPVGRAFRVKGPVLEGISTGTFNDKLYWSRWRGTVAFAGKQLVYTPVCGLPERMATEYSLDPDGVTLFIQDGPTTQAWKFRKLP